MHIMLIVSPIHVTLTIFHVMSLAMKLLASRACLTGAKKCESHLPRSYTQVGSLITFVNGQKISVQLEVRVVPHRTIWQQC